MTPLFRPDRSTKPAGRFLVWKVRLFAAGATLGLAGIFFDQPPFVWGAIGLLTGGILLRFLPSESDEG